MLAEDGTLGILVLHVEGVAAPCILRLGSNRVKQRAGRRAGEAVAVFPHEVDHIRSHAAQHLLVVLCKTTGGKCGSWASPCELHPVDHPNRPGSHQQSRHCCSNLQSSPLPLILVKHIIWKIWGATPKYNLSLSTRKVYLTKSSKFKEFKIQRVQNPKSSKFKEFKIQRVQNSKSSKFKEFKEFKNHKLVFSRW